SLPGLALVCGLAFAAGAVLLLAGQVRCCAAPAEARVRGRVIASLACLGIALLLVPLLVLLRLRGEDSLPADRQAGLLVALALAAAVLAGHVLLVSFLRGLAWFFGNRPLAQQALGYAVCFALFAAGGVASVALAASAGMHVRDERAFHLVLLALAVVALLFTLSFLVLVRGTRASVAEACRSGRRRLSA